MHKNILLFHFKSRIKNQIRLVFLISVILPVLALGTFSAFHIRNLMLEHYTEQIRSESIRVNSILFELTTSIYTSIEPISLNTSYMSLLGSDFHGEDYQETYKELCSHMNYLQKNTAAVSFMHIYTDNPNIKSNSVVSYINDYSAEDWYQNMPKGSWASWERSTRKTGHDQEITELCLIKKFGIASDRYSAYMILCLDNNYLRNRIEQNSYEIMASVDNTTLFYSSNYNNLEALLPVSGDFKKEYYNYTGPASVNGRTGLTNILSFKSYKTNNNFYVSASDYSAYFDINRFTLLYTTTILLLTIIPSIIIMLFSAFFSRRTNTLKRAMHQASLGDYDIIDHFRGDDELSDTFHDLKATVEAIKENTALYYEARINNQKLINKQQQMEYNMLASQINPHFLYNTLETIRVQALSEHCMDVVSSINLLGKSMRYVLENTGTNTTTLERELDYIKTYLAIQKLRFGDRVNSVFEIGSDCDISSIYILPLLLQPIVENAIVHGIEDIYGEGYITIHIEKKGRYLFISIRDNGIGMDTETLQNIRKNLEENEQNNTKSIGLYNINQRIKLFYGKPYGLTLDSRKDNGTTITLSLPYSIIFREGETWNDNF